jgi:hypothetical protein
MYKEAFRQLGRRARVDSLLLQENVWREIGEHGEVVWHPVFLVFAPRWASACSCAGVRRTDYEQRGIGREVRRNGHPR